MKIFEFFFTFLQTCSLGLEKDFSFCFLFTFTIVKYWFSVSLGRASASPVVDLFITLLSMGVQGYTSLMTQRSEHMDYLRTRLGEVANSFDLQLLQTKNNPISIGEHGQNILKFLVILLLYFPCVFFHFCIIPFHASCRAHHS